ncbi:hypothetical protein AOT83_12010 [Mycobacteroides sp. H001]|uniref:hypothetical protein n=1 Tax=unclassified Mycobacteroides TaxID=2618759 RepID=UPI000712BBF7|nr:MULTISPECIES: hypothetical protein [unclassified Mycobacteroides]KRQ20520.1 hypothetical protein AOT86_23370 [Mycobacteroides sp. H072]KRQ34356.1 hypothetical protein AOT84_18310 [Mycobacteroides sp. H002]KRQ52603.1 hypothetical protein AOT85_08930 [Mycobacteroides sp. H054]KRQ70515.1 hypothetical protein AOT83_12010 [Mycobacteroides sp. H001]
MTEPQPGLDGLLRHAKARSADARARIDKAIRDLRRQHVPININAVARAAGVTRKTIYRNPEQLARIRAHNPLRTAATPASGAPAGAMPTSIVAGLRRELSTQRNQHRAQITDLHAQLKEKDAALAAAHGEIARLTAQLHLGS